MPSIIRYSYSTRPGGWYVNSSCTEYPPIVYIGAEATSRTTTWTQWNSKDSRPKPQGKLSLVFSPTNQALQFRSKHWPCEGTYQSSLVNGYCPSAGYIQWPLWTAYAHEKQHSLEQPELQDWALAIRRKIGNEDTSLGQSMVEYRQTANMFQQFGRVARDGWRAMHGKLPARRRKKITPCTVASAYLMNSYGIQPLAADLFDSYETLRNKLELPLIKRYHTRTSGVSSFSIDDDTQLARGSRRTSQNVAVYCQFKQGTSNMFSCGNPAELAWEVIPFSFVVDWAIPIGKTLAALDALTKVEKVAGTITTKEKTSITYRSKHISYGGHWGVAQVPGGYEYESHRRDAIFNVPLPRVPRWEPSKSYKAVLNGLALLTQVNQRCK